MQQSETDLAAVIEQGIKFVDEHANRPVPEIVTATIRVPGIGVFKTEAYGASGKFAIEMCRWGPFSDREAIRETLKPKLAETNELPCFFHAGERWMRWGLSKDPLHYCCYAVIPIDHETGLTPAKVTGTMSKILLAMDEHWERTFTI